MIPCPIILLPELQGTGSDQLHGYSLVAAHPLPHEALDPKGCDLLGDQVSQNADYAMSAPGSLDSYRRQAPTRILFFLGGGDDGDYCSSV